MLCCLVGGLLVAALARAARSQRAHNPFLAVAFGFGAGALVVELIAAVLVPLGGAHAPGSLAGRLSVLIVPALVAAGAGLGGAAGSLLTRPGVMTVATSAVAGAVAAEELDLHLLRLHSAVGVVPAVAIHAPAFLFLLAGLRWRSNIATCHLNDAMEATRSVTNP